MAGMPKNGKSVPHCWGRGGSTQFAQQLESAVTAPPLVGCVVNLKPAFLNVASLHPHYLKFTLQLYHHPEHRFRSWLTQMTSLLKAAFHHIPTRRRKLYMETGQVGLGVESCPSNRTTRGRLPNELDYTS